MNDITKAITLVKEKGNSKHASELYYRLSELIKTKYKQDNDLMELFHKVDQNPLQGNLLERLDEALIAAGANRDDKLNGFARELIKMLGGPGVKFSASGTVKSEDYLTFEQSEDDW
jgi:hypothetical protein